MQRLRTAGFWGTFLPRLHDACPRKLSVPCSSLLQGVKVHAFADFEKLGASKPSDATPPKPEDPACIMYTSGTTGAPGTLKLSWGRPQLGPWVLQHDRQGLHC